MLTSYIRGQHESSGQFRHAGFASDVEDISAVVAYMTNCYGYKVDLILAHSRGSVSSMWWMCTSVEGRAVKGFVNVSARYQMHVSYTGN